MQVFKRLISYYKYRSGQFALATVFKLLNVAAGIYAPVILSQLIDYVSLQLQRQEDIQASVLWQYFGQYMLLTLAIIVTGYISYIVFARIANYLAKLMRDQAFDSLQQLPVSYFDQRPAGKISSRIVNDTEVIRQNFFHPFANDLLANILSVLGLYLAIFAISWRMGLVLLILVPIIVIWQLAYMRLIQPINHRKREAESQINTHTADIVQGYQIVQVYQQEEAVLEEFKQSNQDLYQSQRQAVVVEASLSMNLATLLRNLSLVVVMAYLGFGFIQGEMAISIGTLYILINYVSRLFDPITQIVRLMTFFQEGYTTAERVFELMDAPAEPDQEAQLLLQEGQVIFDQVSFAYKEGHPVLKDINLQVQAGQTVGLVGHTGSGKSSMINLLMRFYDPQKGQILIDGQVIQNYSRESVRRDMGIVLQDPYLFTGTIASNVSMNNPDIDDDQVEAALRQVGAGPMLAKLPQGIHTPVTEKGQGLSSGERQLISFARALASDPRILILDEATSHIDSTTEDLIQEAMRVVQEGRTSIIIAHRLSTIQEADQIIVLDRGEIVERGDHHQLMALDGQYAQMYQMQSEGL